ncbi:MAG: sulfur carrier protein ThiS adenylyltransferase ThiF [Lachnospiraceae bacterium]|nr:sulfur carrier protein ThiS adenylyltransferase ThiF [Lachnospiraceae bacterium]
MEMPTKDEVQKALELRHGAELQRKFSGATVAVCGLGGLGSNIAIALARAGVGKLILIDFDRVDLTNLNRQQYAVSQLGQEKAVALKDILKAVAPYIEVKSHSVRVTENNLAELLSMADVICEAFDRAEEKAMLVNGVLEQLPEKFLVAGSGMAGIGSANSIKTRRVTKHFYLCGDGVSDSAETGGLFAARVMVCAAHQAHMVLRLLAGEEEP